MDDSKVTDAEHAADPSTNAFSDSARRIREKNPGRVPIICHVDHTASVPGWKTKRTKFLVSVKLNVSHFRRFVRCNLKYSLSGWENEDESADKKGPPLSEPPKVSLFFSDGSELEDGQLGISQLDEQYRSPDGFLYLKYRTWYPSSTADTQNVVAPSDDTALESIDNKVVDDKLVDHKGGNNNEQLAKDESIGPKPLKDPVIKTNDEVEEESMQQPSTSRMIEETEAEKATSEAGTSNTPQGVEKDSNFANASEKMVDQTTTAAKVPPLVSNPEEEEEECNKNAKSSTPKETETLGDERIEKKADSEQKAASMGPNADESSPAGVDTPIKNQGDGHDGSAKVHAKAASTIDQAESFAFSFAEHPATAQDMDALYKSPLYTATAQERDGLYHSPIYTSMGIDSSLAPKLDLNKEDGSADGNSESSSALYSRTAQISERRVFPPQPSFPSAGNKQQQQHQHLDSALFNVFDSMVLSDDSGSKTTEDALSHSHGIDSTHGWPSLSRDSTLEDRTPPLDFIQPSMLEHSGEEHRQEETSSFVTLNEEGHAGDADEDNSTCSGGDEWVQIDEGDSTAAAHQANEEARRTSLEKGKAFLIEKMNMFQAHPINEKFKSKAASLRNMAANMIKLESEKPEIYSGGAKQSNQFVHFDGASEDGEFASGSDAEEQWTCVNFDGNDESFGAAFL